MIDLEDELVAYGREWRAAQPALPDTMVDRKPTRRRPRALMVAAVLVVVVALSAAAFIVTRSDPSTPTIDAPPTTQAGFVPKVEVVPVYLPIDAADMYSVGALSERVAVRIVDTSRPPTHAEQVQAAACAVALIGGGPGNTYDYEDPGSYHGTPLPVSVEPPPAPPTAPRCTTPAARAAARIRTIVRKLGWRGRVPELDADPTIAAAKQQDIECLHDHGIDSVASDGYVNDGYNIAHPEQRPQTRLTFADCFAPVVAARAPVRAAFRDTFVAEHREQIDALQTAFDDYLRAVYTPAPHAKTVTTEPDLARFESGCVRVASADGAMPAIDSTDALSIARVRLHDPGATPSQSLLGQVTVCDQRVHDRLAWTFEFPGHVVVIDASDGAMLLDRPVSAT